MRFQPSSCRGTMRGTIVPGLILGLVIGLAIAAFIAWTWNKEPTYNERVRSDQERLRSERERDVREQRLNEGSGDGVPPRDAEGARSNAAPDKPVVKTEEPAPKEKVSPEDRERFDFYKILPGIEEARPVSEEERKREEAQLDDLLQKEKSKENKDAKKKKQRSPEDEDNLNQIIDKIQEGGSVNNDQEAARAKPVKRWLLQAGAFENEEEADRLKADLAMAGMEARVIRSKDSHDQTVYRVRLGPYIGDTEVDRARAELKRQGIKATSIPLKEDRL